jgi:hypothetical protein
MSRLPLDGADTPFSKGVDMRKRYALIASIFTALGLPLVAWAGGGGGDSIWISSVFGAAAPSPTYGSSFTAGYSSKTSQPWGFAQCWANGTTVLGTPNQGSYKPGSVIWSEYRSLYPGGPEPGPFQLTDPIQHLWLAGGATCTLSLLKFSAGLKSSTVLATTPFTVAG